MAKTIATEKYPFAMLNFAPPDMVGHTGVYEAAVKACEATGNRFTKITINFHRYIGFMLNLENQENRAFLRKVRENLE